MKDVKSLWALKGTTMSFNGQPLLTVTETVSSMEAECFLPLLIDVLNGDLKAARAKARIALSSRKSSSGASTG